MSYFQKQEAKRGRYYPGGRSVISTAASESWEVRFNVTLFFTFRF